MRTVPESKLVSIPLPYRLDRYRYRLDRYRYRLDRYRYRLQPNLLTLLFALDDMDDTVLTLTDEPWNLGDWQLFVEKCWSSDDNGPDECSEPELAYQIAVHDDA